MKTLPSILQIFGPQGRDTSPDFVYPLTWLPLLGIGPSKEDDLDKESDF